MFSRWNDADADAAITRWGDRWGRDLALRVYTSRLIGAEPALVMHGGGNTSVKGSVRNAVGDDVPVVFVKGSGWDLATIEPPGFPAVQLDHCRRLCRLPELSDEAMINELRTHLLDASAPNPSIEALLHAFIDARFVDHSHADAILSLTNHPGGEALIREVLGPDVLIVPYVKPGFDLATLCARYITDNPGCTSMVLMQHGLFTWSDDARTAYEDHLRLVTLAEDYVRAKARPPVPRAGVTEVHEARRRAAEIAPVLRGALAHAGKRFLLDHRVDAELLGLLDDDRLDRWVAAGPLTPDHVIRTRRRAAVIRLPADDQDVRAAIHSAVAAWGEADGAYYAGQVAGRPLKRLDPIPRVVLIPGVGLFGVGETVGAAGIAADIAARALVVKEENEGIGPFEGLPDDLLFEIEYWSLEQAKLGKAKEAPLARQVALITGGAGAIGVGIARKLLEAGACVVLADRDLPALERAVAAIGARKTLSTVLADVTSEASLEAAFRHTAATFGGVDIVVPNAGIAHVGAITELSADDFRRVQEVNGTGAFLTIQAAARTLVRQSTGGHIILISSKNVFGPGEQFSAYSAAKASAHQVGRIAAMELASHGIAVNMINPDAVFAQDGIPSGLWATVGPDRARSRGLTTEELPEFYRQRNLLRATVTGEHVGNAVVFFASNLTPTTGAALPVDGGVATAFPR